MILNRLILGRFDCFKATTMIWYKMKGWLMYLGFWGEDRGRMFDISWHQEVNHCKMLLHWSGHISTWLIQDIPTPPYKIIVHTNSKNIIPQRNSQKPYVSFSPPQGGGCQTFVFASLRLLTKSNCIPSFHRCFKKATLVGTLVVLVRFSKKDHLLGGPTGVQARHLRKSCLEDAVWRPNRCHEFSMLPCLLGGGGIG